MTLYKGQLQQKLKRPREALSNLYFTPAVAPLNKRKQIANLWRKIVRSIQQQKRQKVAQKLVPLADLWLEKFDSNPNPRESGQKTTG